MTRRVIIECGVAETRGALVDHGRVIRFWFGPARGDEHEHKLPVLGEHYIARVRAVDRALSAAFLDIGAMKDGFLPLKHSYEDDVREGALIEVSVKALPRQSKGARFNFVGVAPDKSEIGRSSSVADPVCEAARTLSDRVTEIVTDQGAALAALRGEVTDKKLIHEDGALFPEQQLDDALPDIFTRAVALNNGGRIIIDEAEALTAIDVDMGALEASSSERQRYKLCIAALDEAIVQVVRRNIGGHIVIDLPSPKAEASRKAIREHGHRAIGKVPGARGAGYSKTGLFSFTVPHGDGSMLERFTQFDDGEPVPARQYTLEWQARCALRQLEWRLAQTPSARFSVVAGARLIEYLQTRPLWLERLDQRYGSRVTFRADKEIKGARYDVIENT